MSRRRGLIPADAFYKWKKIGTKEKQPFGFDMTDDSVFAFARLGNAVEIRPVRSWKHARSLPRSRTLWSLMYMFVCRQSIGRKTSIFAPCWLSQPFDSKLMRKYPVGTRENRPENDDQDSVIEVPIAGSALTLLF
jgi:hypothetical protein